MPRTTRSTAGLIVAGVLGTLLPLGFALPASAARVKTIKIADATIIEGNAGQQSMSFRVTWSGAKGGGGVSVSYATADITATAGNDYTTKTGSVSLTGGGCRCGTFAVPILGDTMSETTETLAVNLSNPVNVTIGDAQAIGTIYDNEGPPALVVLDGSADESAGTVSFGVMMTSTSGSTQTVDYATSDGSALAATDYTATSGTLTFTSGQTSTTVNVPVTNDTLNEGDEIFTLSLSNATVAVTDGVATGSIFNDDAEPTVSIADASAPEPDGVVSFTISLSTASGQEIDVDYATNDGTADSANDFKASTGTAVIPAGTTSVQLDVSVVDDSTYEGDETLTVDISAPYNATILDNQAGGTITNDDGLPVASIGDATVHEGDAGTTAATFTVSLSNPSAFSATVDWASADVTATAGTDYTAGSGTLTFNPGETSQQVAIDVIGDTAKETAETFTVALTNPTGATAALLPGLGTITDDDRTPTVLTEKVTKTRTKVGAKGLLKPAAANLKVTVKLLKKKGTKWVTLSTKSVTVRKLADRDGNGQLDATYRTGFARPGKGSTGCGPRSRATPTWPRSRRARPSSSEHPDPSGDPVPRRWR